MVGRACLRSLTVAFWLLSPAACDPAAAADHKRVILLHSFGQHFMPWSEYAKAIRAELARQSPWPLDFVDQSVVAARSGAVTSETPFIEYLASLQAEQPFDLIVTLGAPAASFPQHHRQRLFPSVPVLLAAVEARRVQNFQPEPNVAVVPVRSDLSGFLDQMLRVSPDTKSV